MAAPSEQLVVGHNEHVRLPASEELERRAPGIVALGLRSVLRAAGARPRVGSQTSASGRGVVLLIIAIAIAIAGGAIVHPILFALGILALVAFFAGSRRGARL